MYTGHRCKSLKASHFANNSKFLRKAISRKSFLQKIYFKREPENEKSLKANKKQKHFCSKLNNDNDMFFSTILARLFLSIRIYSEKLLHHSFQTRKITDLNA